MPVTLLAVTNDNFGCLIDPKIKIDSIPHPGWSNHSVYLIYPDSTKAHLPVVLLCHGIDAFYPGTYDGLIKHIIDCNCAVMFSPYEAFVMKPEKSCAMIWSGFEAGAEKWDSIIDMQRICFAGHSYGGGAVPGIAIKALKEHHWGSCASFLYIMAPWYSYGISQEQLESFPQNTRLVIQIFENDHINDPRMAFDIFNSIGISQKNKWIVQTFNDTCEGHLLEASHSAPEKKCFSASTTDSLEFYGISHVIDAMTSYIKSSDENALIKTFGNGNSPYIRQAGCLKKGQDKFFIPEYRQLIRPEICYVNFWHHAMNQRVDAADKTKNTHKTDMMTTISNYFWLWYYPLMQKGQERDLEEKAFDQWDADAEYRDTDVYKSMINKRKETYTCGPEPIKNGYGSCGPYGVGERFFPNTGSFGSGKLHIFIPDGEMKQYPIVYFATEPGYSAQDYRELLFHIASQGYIVASSSGRNGIFPGKKRNKSLKNGFEICNQLLAGLIDTTRIGFVSHACGANTVLCLAGKYLGERKWGSKGSFIFFMAPDNCYGDEKIDFQLIPSRTRIVIQIYEEDAGKEWKYARDLFGKIKVPDSEKALMTINNYKDDSCEIEAGHDTPFCEKRDENLNCIDDYGIFRPLSALADYAFNNSEDAKNIVFGAKSSPDFYVEKNKQKWIPIKYFHELKNLMWKH